MVVVVVVVVVVVGLGLRVGGWGSWGGGGGAAVAAKVATERVLVLYLPLGDVGAWLVGVLEWWSGLKSEEELRWRQA